MKFKHATLSMVLGCGLCAAGLASAANDWAGLYVGANISTAEATGVNLDFGGGIKSDSFSTSGSMYGLQMGYDWNFSGVVVGLEGAYSSSNIEGSANCPNPTWECKAQIDSMYNLGARVGKQFGNILVYGSVDYVSADTKVMTIQRASGNTYPDSKTATGMAYGLGVAMKFTPNISGYLEAKQVNLDSNDYTVDFGSVVAVEMDPMVYSIGANWHF